VRECSDYIPDKQGEHLGSHHEDEGSNGEGLHVSSKEGNKELDQQKKNKQQQKCTCCMHHILKYIHYIPRKKNLDTL
jgi:hypothetical protein